MTDLLDVNVLVALTIPDHVHREPARQWFATRGTEFATCPLTELGLVRVSMRLGSTLGAALSALRSITGHVAHARWPDDLAVDDLTLRGVTGHRQVTDAYLAALARHHDGQLVTFDRAIGALHPDVAVVIPT